MLPAKGSYRDLVLHHAPDRDQWVFEYRSRGLDVSYCFAFPVYILIQLLATMLTREDKYTIQNKCLCALA